MPKTLIKNLFFFSLVLFIPKSSFAIIGTGLQVAATGDVVYTQGLNETSSAADKVTLRGAEISLFSPIDYQFDGVLTAAAHDESGETVFELHELYIRNSRLIPRTSFRVGQFFLGIGRINRFHQHDWPFTTAPKVHQEFLDDEGVFDAGLESSFLLPLTFSSTLTLGLTSGYRYGHAHTEGDKPKAPTHYGRYSFFIPFSNTSGVESGVSYLGRTDSNNISTSLFGADTTWKWRQGQFVKYLIQAEGWYRIQESDTTSRSRQAGFYIFNDYAFNNFYSLGARFDGFTDLDKIHSITGRNINNFTYGATLQVTYHSSEFAKIRLGVSHQFTREEGIKMDEDTRLELQLVYILGSHPAHDF